MRFLFQTCPKQDRIQALRVVLNLDDQLQANFKDAGATYSKLHHHLRRLFSTIDCSFRLYCLYRERPGEKCVNRLSRFTSVFIYALHGNKWHSSFELTKMFGYVTTTLYPCTDLIVWREVHFECLSAFIRCYIDEPATQTITFARGSCCFVSVNLVIYNTWSVLEECTRSFM